MNTFMTQRIMYYRDGERNCPVCRRPLPAHVTWPGARYHFCGRKKCAAALRSTAGRGYCTSTSGPRLRYIGARQVRCSWSRCKHYVAEGLYSAKRTYYIACSAECWRRRYLIGSVRGKCACGCGMDVLRRGRQVGKRMFVSKAHHSDYLHRTYLNKSCGPFRALYEEYASGFALIHYRVPKNVSTVLGTFFSYLTGIGHRSIRTVTPKTVTQYLAWSDRQRHRTSRRGIAKLSVFFQWAIVEGHYRGSNPVVRGIHKAPKSQCESRPLREEESKLMWQLLERRGNDILRFAAAAGEEGGLRLGEMCRVRPEDVDVAAQRIFVRLPNKANREGYAFFGEKTKKYFLNVLAARPACGHPELLINQAGRPFKPISLAEAFRRVLCKSIRGKVIHEEGFDKWSTHRLRHTMATRLSDGGATVQTLLAAGRWASASMLRCYVKQNLAAAQRGFEEANERARANAARSSAVRVITPAEALKMARKEGE